MAAERKTEMIWGRVPGALRDRVDNVVRNTSDKSTKNRSAVLRSALEAWLPDREKEIERKLGAAAPGKVRT